MLASAITELANRVANLEARLEHKDADEAMSYDDMIQMSADRLKEALDENERLGNRLEDAQREIARLEAVIEDQDEQIAELITKVELYANRRICGVWSL